MTSTGATITAGWRRRRPGGLPAVLPVLAAVLAAGCGEAPSPERPSVERLTLTPAAEAHPWERLRTLTSFSVAGRVPPGWSIEADEWSMHEVDAGPVTTVLHVAGDEPIRVRIPGPFDAAMFNELELQVFLIGQEDFRLSFESGDAIVARTEAKRVFGDGTLHVLVFDVADVHARGGIIDAVTIEIPGRYLRSTYIPPGPNLGIASLELRLRPAAQRLPDPSGPPELVAFGGEWRRATALSALRPLTADLTVEVGDRLELAAAVPAGGSEATLMVRLEDADGTSLHEQLWPLDGTESWNTLILPLDDYADDGAPSRLVAWFELDDEGEDGDAAVVALAEPRRTGSRSAPRAVVLVTSDTHRADHLGALGTDAGGVEVSTPFLDGLAKRGLMFEDATSATNLTNPGHIAVMTGLSPRDTGVFDNFTPVGSGALTLAEHFRDAGWETWAAVSASHLQPDLSGLGQGFDRVSAPLEPQRDSMETLARLEAWLAEGGDNDLFLWLHVFDAHGPYEVRWEYERLYYPEGRNPYDPSLPELPADRVHTDMAGLRDPEYALALYKGEVTYLDERLSQALSRPRFTDAVVGFTADHGEALLEHRVYFSHGELYPATLRVPLIVAGPGVPALRSRAPVSYLDLGRTLLDLAGLTDAEFPGRNLVQVAAGAPEVTPRFALSARSEVAGVFMETWFLALHLVEHVPSNVLPPVPRHRVELYDLSADPTCQVDLSAERPEVARRLRRLLMDWLGEARGEDLASAPDALDVSTLEDLVELGYTGDRRAGPEEGFIDPDCDCPRCEVFR